MITSEVLRRLGVGETQADLFINPVNAACDKFFINTAKRQAAFLAQCVVESGAFKCLEENLNYTSAERLLKIFPSRIKTLLQASQLVGNPEKIANTVYSLKYGNGDYYSGDGWKYRGSGLIQLTFKDNFTQAEKAIGQPYVAQPDLVRQPEGAVLTAAHYMLSRGCNEKADRGDIDAVTRAVNPAMLEADKRARLYVLALQLL